MVYRYTIWSVFVAFPKILPDDAGEKEVIGAREECSAGRRRGACIGSGTIPSEESREPAKLFAVPSLVAGAKDLLLWHPCTMILEVFLRLGTSDSHSRTVWHEAAFHTNTFPSAEVNNLVRLSLYSNYTINVQYTLLTSIAFCST